MSGVTCEDASLLLWLSLSDLSEAAVLQLFLLFDEVTIGNVIILSFPGTSGGIYRLLKVGTTLLSRLSCR